MKIEKINTVNATFVSEANDGEYQLSADVQMRGGYTESIMNGSVKKDGKDVARFSTQSQTSFDVSHFYPEQINPAEVSDMVQAFIAEAKALAQTEPFLVKNI
jgi:hypothetical protein